MVYHIKRKLLQILILAVFAGLLLLPAVRDNSTANRFQQELREQTKDTIPIVFLCPTTGYYSFVGEDAAWTARYAVEQINASGGINGKKVQLFLKDTRSSKNLAVSYFLGASRETPAVIGPVEAPSSSSIAPLLEDSKTTSIASYSYKDIRNTYQPYTIAYMNDSETGEYLAVKKWSQHNPDIKKVVIFTDTTDEAKNDSVTLLKKMLPELNLQLLDVIDLSGTRDQRHFEQCAIQALNKKADGYISLLSADDYTNILHELKKRGISEGRRITASFSSMSSQLLTSAKDNLDQTFIWNKFDLNYNEQQWRALKTAYQRSHNGEQPVNTIIPDIYNAILALCQCYDELDLSGTETDDASRQKVNEWFQNPPVIQGIQGDFTWENGRKIADYYFFKFEGQNLTPLS